MYTYTRLDYHRLVILMITMILVRLLSGIDDVRGYWSMTSYPLIRLLRYFDWYMDIK